MGNPSRTRRSPDISVGHATQVSNQIPSEKVQFSQLLARYSEFSSRLEIPCRLLDIDVTNCGRSDLRKTHTRGRGAWPGVLPLCMNGIEPYACPMTSHQQLHRSALLVGEATLASLAETRVILFGVGGVGSWCAEALIRSGIGHLTVVDSDLVCVTNLNRQLQATRATIGQPKVAVLRDRLHAINPDAVVEALDMPYTPTTRDQFNLAAYDYVLDAIDSLANKVDLIATALRTDTTLFAAMGAACKLDATAVRAASIWDTGGCPLARLVRKELRRRGIADHFQCVYSEEVQPGFEIDSACGTDACCCPPRHDAGGNPVATDTWCRKKARINGSSVHVTGTFGFVLAGLVLQDVHTRAGGATRSP